jgi:hypothetical protein
MLTYQVRPRIFRHGRGNELRLPNRCTLRFHFAPDQPFGVQAGGGRTAVRAKPAHALFDSNTGAHTIESTEPLAPLEVTIEEPIRIVRMQGTVFEVNQEFSTLLEMHECIESLYALPMLLNVNFADPPYIERVDGEIDGVPFRWELAGWQMEFTTTTQDEQEAKICTAWRRFESGVCSRESTPIRCSALLPCSCEACEVRHYSW